MKLPVGSRDPTGLRVRYVDQLYTIPLTAPTCDETALAW